MLTFIKITILIVQGVFFSLVPPLKVLSTKTPFMTQHDGAHPMTHRLGQCERLHQPRGAEFVWNSWKAQKVSPGVHIAILQYISLISFHKSTQTEVYNKHFRFVHATFLIWKLIDLVWADSEISLEKKTWWVVFSAPHLWSVSPSGKLGFVLSKSLDFVLSLCAPLSLCVSR